MKNIDTRVRGVRQRDEEVEPLALRWADQIQVVQRENEIVVLGERAMFDPIDLMVAYERVITPAHVQLANCSTDTKLFEFVKAFGPVNGTTPASLSPPVDLTGFERHWTVASKRGFTKFGDVVGEAEHMQRAESVPYEVRCIVQNMAELRSERNLMWAALDLIQGRTGNAPDVVSDSQTESRVVRALEILAESTKAWASQFRRERREMAKDVRFEVPEWNWSDAHQSAMEDYAVKARKWLDLERTIKRERSFAESLSSTPRQNAEGALSLLLNAFPLNCRIIGDRFEETPPHFLMHGIRPLLFAMLRRDLSSGRSLRMCNRPSCGRYFVASRIDKQSCSEECSKRVANKKRYVQKVKPERQKAAAEREQARASVRKSKLKERG